MPIISTARFYSTSNESEFVVRIQYWLVYGALQIEECKNAEREHSAAANDKYDKQQQKMTTTTTPTRKSQ